AKKEKEKEHRQIIQGHSNERYFRFEVVVKEKKCEPSGAFFVIHLLPPMILQNLFTVPVKVEKSLTIAPGQQLVVNRTKGESIDLVISYLNEEFH
ncbi:hypothetical protein PMAYCL1PPCAC_07702, partial [Pristionchus mayeri]